MSSSSHSSDEGATLVAVAGANTTDADSWNASDHQSIAHQTPLAFQSDALGMISNVPNEAPAREPSVWAAKEDWARYQALIKQHYLYEKKPLKEVMRHMEDQYGFRATIKMYKTHIQQWGLDKKIKDVEMRAVVRKNKQRADQGKSSIIRVRGQRRGLEDFIRHCDRKRVSIDDIIARHTASPTPDTVELLTPVPSRISTPQVLEIPERMFRFIRDYFSGSFERGTWIRTEPNMECYSIKCGERAAVHADEFFIQCDAACKLFSRNLFEEGGQTLKAAFAKTERILLADQPQTLHKLFLLISYIRRGKRDEMAFIILRHFSDLSKELLGREHPLTHIFGWYDLLYASDFDEIVGRCMEGMIDQCESFVGAMHTSTLVFRTRSIDFVAQQKDTRIRKALRFVSECEGNLQPYDHRVFLVRGFLAIEYYKQDYYVEAMTISQENFANSKFMPSENFRKHFETASLHWIAICQYALGEVDLGIANLHEAINLRISVWGPQEPEARQWLLHLEDWHLEQGNWNVVEQIRDWRMRTLPPIED